MKKKLQTMLYKRTNLPQLQYQKNPKKLHLPGVSFIHSNKKNIEYLKSFHMNQIKHCKF